MDISEATDTVVQTEYVCEELSTKRLERVLGAVPGSSNKFRQSSIRKEHVCFKYFVGISAKKERKKEKCCS